MWSFLVVDVHGLLNHFSGLTEVGRSLKQELHLQNPVDALGQRILVAVVAIGHRTRNAVARVNRLILTRAVLDAAVRVMHQRLPGLPALERRLQGLADLLCPQAVMHVVPDDLARPGIRDQAEVDEPLVGRQVGDVGHPDLLASARAHLPGPRLEQVRVPVKPVAAVGRLVIRPAGRHQQAGLAQHVKQRITPQAGLRLSQRLAEHVVQLARAYPRLAQPHRAHELDHGVRTLTAVPVMLQLLVVGLAANAPVAGSPRDAQLREELLREDLPKGFFTTRTP